MRILRDVPALNLLEHLIQIGRWEGMPNRGSYNLHLLSGFPDWFPPSSSTQCLANPFRHGHAAHARCALDLTHF